MRLKGTLVQNDGGDTAEIGCFRGQYSPTYTYYKADEVLYNANGNTATYRCISELPITGHPPTDNTRWKIYAQGADGHDGKDGADGQDGQDGIDGNYFEYSPDCYYGVVIEFGFMLKIKKVFVNMGMMLNNDSNNFKDGVGNFGIGYFF